VEKDNKPEMVNESKAEQRTGMEKVNNMVQCKEERRYRLGKGPGNCDERRRN
jgi:hypothetical protein